ncbi:MAG: hypothetical protein U1F57_00055 [bacterium]
MNSQNEQITDLYNMAINQLMAATDSDCTLNARLELMNAEKTVSTIEQMTMLNPDSTEHDIVRIVQLKRSKLWNQALERASATV